MNRLLVIYRDVNRGVIRIEFDSRGLPNTHKRIVELAPGESLVAFNDNMLRLKALLSTKAGNVGRIIFAAPDGIRTNSFYIGRVKFNDPDLSI